MAARLEWLDPYLLMEQMPELLYLAWLKAEAEIPSLWEKPFEAIRDSFGAHR